MHKSGDTLVLAATDTSNFLACDHLTARDYAVKEHRATKPPKFPDPGLDFLRDLGHWHEDAIVTVHRDSGREVLNIEPPEGEFERGWTGRKERTLEAMKAGVDVIWQGCFFDGTWLGRPDFLVKRPDHPSDLGDWSYEVVDAKLARSAKAGAVLQISFYAEMLAAIQRWDDLHYTHAAKRSARDGAGGG